MTTAIHVAAQIKQLLVSLQEPRLAPFLSDWPLAVATRTVAPCTLSVLRWLPRLAEDPDAFGSDLVNAVYHAAPLLAWRQTYTVDDVDTAFLDNYGWSEILGTAGPLPSARIACGFLLLGPSTHYPRHRHEAEEIYLPLCGTAAWQQGDAIWRERAPGTVIHHAGEEPHAMRTGGGPLLALYLWRSNHLAQKARLDKQGAPA
jgi:Dimethlysulfonioproprionate lyase